MNNKEIIKEVIEMGGDMSGSVSGAVVGTLVAGPAGLVIGGVSGVIVTKLFKSIGKEIQERVLGSREELRIGAVYTFALHKINENQNQGKLIRDDNFFSERDGNRPFSEEILEGIILTAQKEYEEQKIKFLGNLYGNICTNSEISNEQANQLIKITNSLTYRQFCLIGLYYKKLNLKPPPSNIMTKRGALFDVIAEMTDLVQKGILWSPKTSNDAPNFSGKRYRITDGGQSYYKMLGLDQIEEADFINLNNLIEI